MTSVGGLLAVDNIPSVNYMYTRTRRGVKLSDEARNYKDACIDQLNKSNLKLPDDYSEEYPFVLTLVFILNHSINKRDLDNMEKLTIDSIYGVLGINDSTVYEKHTFKMISDCSMELIRYKISQSDKKFSEYKIWVTSI